MSHFESEPGTDEFDDAPNPSDEGTVFADLRAALAAPTNVKPLTLRVPLRPTIELVYRPAYEFDLLKRWMKAAATGKKFDQLQLSCAIMAFTNIGVKFNGELQKDEYGENLTLKHKDFREMLNAVDVRDTIKKLFGAEEGDGYVLQHGNRINAEAGYADEVDLEGDEEGPDPLDQ